MAAKTDYEPEFVEFMIKQYFRQAMMHFDSLPVDVDTTLEDLYRMKIAVTFPNIGNIVMDYRLIHNTLLDKQKFFERHGYYKFDNPDGDKGGDNR